MIGQRDDIFISFGPFFSYVLQSNMYLKSDTYCYQEGHGVQDLQEECYSKDLLPYIPLKKEDSLDQHRLFKSVF